MEAHDKNGRVIANFLAEHPSVQKVYYPGLVSHPQHELAKQPANGFWRDGIFRNWFAR